MTTINLMTLDALRDSLAQMNLSTVAKATGLSYPTVHAIAKGTNRNPQLETVRRLSDYVREVAA